MWCSLRSRLGFHQLFDQPRGFEFVELFDTLAEPFLGQRFNVVFGEVLFVHQFEDQLLLFGRAVPVVAFRAILVAGMGVATVTIPIPVALAVTVGMTIGGSGGLGEETGLLNGGVHGLLQESVETLAFRRSLGEIGDFGADGEAVLVRRITGQTDLLAVVGFKGDGHNVIGELEVEMKRPWTGHQ